MVSTQRKKMRPFGQAEAQDRSNETLSEKMSFLPLPLDASNTESLPACELHSRAHSEILFSVCEVTDHAQMSITGNGTCTF